MVAAVPADFSWIKILAVIPGLDRVAFTKWAIVGVTGLGPKVKDAQLPIFTATSEPQRTRRLVLKYDHCFQFKAEVDHEQRSAARDWVEDAHLVNP